MRLMALESQLEGNASGDEDTFVDAETPKNELPEPPTYPSNTIPHPPPAYPNYAQPPLFSIPPTIPECDE